jgi:signal transduction histidine kinase/CheY-like chemotaxis protein
VEAEFQRHDGAVVPMSQVLLSHRGRDGQVELYSTIARDVSRERQLEETVRQSQKMEAVGRLAGGIAHDFNNMLCALLGLAHLGAEQVGPGGKAHAELQEIIGVGERAAALTRQLLAFGRRQVLRPRVVDVGTILGRMSPMIRRLVGENIELTVSVPDAPVRVKVDPTHLEQVVMNLAINGGDAIENGCGHLRIACRRREVDAAHGARLDLAAGRYAVIAVSDDGVGMDAQTRARVFEPFFTTKGPGRGTGLGLATVFGIVKQSGGNVLVESEVGRGSVFEAYLPISDEPLAEEPAATPKPARRPGSAIILVAEDDASVRQVVVTVLTRAGYRVLEAAHPHHALDLAHQHAGPIDLLLTDVVMPAMSGKELARQLCMQRPGLAVLCMSGYSDEAIASRGVLDAGVHLLAKPVTPDQLLKAVAEVLERR